MNTPINEPLKINNKCGIEFYYEIEQQDNEQSANDRLVILDSNKQYFNDFLLQEDDREEEIKALLDVLEATTLQEMCYHYDYQIFSNLTQLSQFAYGKVLTKDEIFEAGYTNVFNVNGKTFFALKSDWRVDENNVDMADFEYKINNVGFMADNYTKDNKGRYEMRGTVYGTHKGKMTELNTNETYDTEDDFDFTYDADTKEITITDIDEIFSVNEIDQIKDILLDNLTTNFKGE